MWNVTEMTLDSIVQKAQKFDDARQSSNSKKSLRTAGRLRNRQAQVRDSGLEEIASGIAEIQAKDARQRV